MSAATAAAGSAAPGNLNAVLAAVCAAGLMLPLSLTGPAIAIPAIGHSLGGSPVALGWVVNAFFLVFGSLVMAAGSLADQVGRKRTFLAGVGLFAATSLAIGIAPNILLLDLLRGLQGVAGALSLTAGTALLAQEFEGAARTRAFGLLGTAFGVGLAAGPLWAGFLVGSLGWRSIFLVNTLIGALVLLGAPRMRETRDPAAAGIDWPGTFTFTGTLGLLTFGIMQGPQSGWGSPLVLGLLLGSAAMLALFVVVEGQRTRPMLDLSLFRSGRFLGVQLLPVAVGFGFITLIVFLPIWFIAVGHASELRAGLLMLPITAPMLVVPFASSRLARHLPVNVLCGTGLLVAAAGALWLARLSPSADPLSLAPAMLLVGIGAGLPWGLMDGLAVSVVPKEQAGMAAGIFTTMRVAGEAVAVAVVSAVLIGVTQSRLSTAADLVPAPWRGNLTGLANQVATGNLAGAVAAVAEPARAGFGELVAGTYTDAFRIVLLLNAALAVVAAAVTFVALRERAPAASAAKGEPVAAPAGPGSHG